MIQAGQLASLTTVRLRYYSVAKQQISSQYSYNHTYRRTVISQYLFTSDDKMKYD